MADRIRKWPAVAAQDADAASRLGMPCAWLNYRATQQGGLQRAGTPAGPGGLLGLTGGLSSQADIGHLAAGLFMECGRRGFEGILLDLDPGDCDDKQLAALSAQLRQRTLVHFVPAALSSAAPEAKVIIPSALSGGIFDEMLAEAADRFGAGSLCLEIVRMCHDFTMPAYAPEGAFLSAGQMRALIERHQPTPYYSPEMCCRYFTYREAECVHFVLFDDIDSARTKIERAQAAGFYGAFALYREWGGGIRDILA